MKPTLLAALLLLNAAVSHAAVWTAPAPLTPDPAGSAQRLPVIGVMPTGVVTFWNEDGTHFGKSNGVAPIAASDAMQLDSFPYREATIATNGNEGYAAWVENDWMYGFIIGADGKPRTEPSLIFMVDSRHTQRLAVAASADRYLFIMSAWTKATAFLFDRDGKLLNRADITMGGGTHNVDKIAAASNGDSFLVVWDTTTVEPWVDPCTIRCPAADRWVHAVVIGHDGNPRPETETILSKNGGLPDVVFNGTSYLAVWSSMPDGGVVGKLIAPDTTTGEDRVFTTGHDFGPRLAWDGRGYTIGFVNADDQSLRVIRTDSLAQNPGTADALGQVSNVRSFALAGNPQNVTIAYELGNQIVARRLVAAPGRLRAVRP